MADEGMSHRAAQVLLFILAAGMLAAGIFLGNEGKDGVAITLVIFGALLALAAAVGPRFITSIESTKEGFTLHTTATPEQIEQSLDVASENPQLPAAEIEKITDEAKARERRTDADYLLMSMNAHRSDNTEEALRYAYAGLSRTSSGVRVKATLLLRVATALFGFGLHDRSLKIFDEAIDTDPSFSWPHNNRAITLRSLDRDEEALAAYDEAIRLAPDEATVHKNRAIVLRALGRFEEALAAYDDTIRLAPDNASAHNNRGVTLHSLGRFEEALATYDEAIRLDPDYALANDNRNLLLSNKPQEGEE